MGSNKNEFKFELFGGTFWFAAWLFTIGLVKLTFWKAVLAVVIWPYYLGVYLR